MESKRSSGFRALLDYQQADMDGTMVLVSRQAIHEVTEEYVDLLQALQGCLAHGLDEGEPASHGYHGVSGPTAQEKRAEAVYQKARAAIRKATREE